MTGVDRTMSTPPPPSQALSTGSILFFFFFKKKSLLIELFLEITVEYLKRRSVENAPRSPPPATVSADE